MKYTLPIAAAMLSTLFSVSLFWGQVLPSEPVGKNSDLSFAYDWDGLDEGGNGDQVDAAEFIFREFPPVSPPVPPLRVLRAKAVVIGQNTYKVTPVLSNVPDREYTLTVRLRDLGGNWSEESVGINILVTSKKPSRPVSLRVVGR